MGHFRDDYSAKTFERPGFKNLRSFCKKNKKEINFLLFLKWDRFSRNTGEAYSVIKEFHNQGIEVNAIDQWMDFENPDNKLMLAIYLAAPEVENDKISIRTKAGMRRAKKEGRWVGTPPLGYSASRDEEDKPIAKPNKKAPIVKRLFEEIAKNERPMEEIRIGMNRKGLNCGRAQIHNLLRNPFYIGRIHIGAWKDEKETVVNGIHEPIISVALFYEVQDVLASRSRPITRNNIHNQELPLRGFLKCSKCGSNITGSRSRSQNGNYFYYYHCQNGCKERFRADIAHKKLSDLLDSIEFDDRISNIYKSILKEVYDRNVFQSKSRKIKVSEQINTTNVKLEALAEKWIENEIEKEVYQRLERKYLNRLVELREEQKNSTTQNSDFENYLNYGLYLLKDISSYYDSSTQSAKHKMLGSIFDKKLEFSKNRYRTAELNEVISWITSNNKHSKALKKRQATKKDDLSNKAPPARFELATYWLTANRSNQLS